MTNTIEEIVQRLIISGLSETDALMLLATFLEEEAKDYIIAAYLAEQQTLLFRD